MPNYYVPYDYAWDTPGFTAQNPIISSPDGTPVGMPSGVTLVNLFGSFLELQTGRSLDGVLRLRVDRILTHIPTGQQVLGGALKTIRFSQEGFSIWLPATDDPDLAPAFVYQARLTVRGHVQEFEFDLPMAALEVNIATKIPLPGPVTTTRLVSWDVRESVTSTRATSWNVLTPA